MITMHMGPMAVRAMSAKEFDRFTRRLAEVNRTYPVELREWPRDEWPPDLAAAVRFTAKPQRVWRSRGFVAVLFLEGAQERLSVNRTTVDHQGRFEDGITWDELMRVKAEAGLGDRWAVEVFPPTPQIVNVSNMRHLWLLPSAPSFGWVD